MLHSKRVCGIQRDHEQEHRVNDGGKVSERMAERSVFFSDVIFILVHCGCVILSFGHENAMYGLAFPPQSQRGAEKTD